MGGGDGDERASGMGGVDRAVDGGSPLSTTGLDLLVGGDGAQQQLVGEGGEGAQTPKGGGAASDKGGSPSTTGGASAAAAGWISRLEAENRQLRQQVWRCRERIVPWLFKFSFNIMSNLLQPPLTTFHAILSSRSKR